MLIQIGTPARQGEDIVSLLVECHGRVRTFASLFAALAHTPRAPESEVRDAAARILRYFGQALPLHARDEEESVLPRLQGKDAALDQALATMEAQHHEHEALLAQVRELCAALEAAPGKLAQFLPSLGLLAPQLADHFNRHLALEESTVFPAIARLVPEAERAAMVTEVRARRSAAR